MSITLYRYALSGHCHRVELFLNLLGLPFQSVDLDLPRGEHKTPEFRALNAFGQVPVIVDEGVPIADANAILTYLALRYAGDMPWIPRDPLGAAQVQRWLSAAAGPLAFGAAAARAIRLFNRPQDAQAVVRAHALFQVMTQTLEDNGTPFLVGRQPTLADIAMYSYTARAPEGGVSLADYPALRAWLERIEALPGFVPMPVSGPAA